MSQNALGPPPHFSSFLWFLTCKKFLDYIFSFKIAFFASCCAIRCSGDVTCEKERKRIGKQAPQHVPEIALFNSHSIPILWNSFPFPSLPHCLDNVDNFTAQGSVGPADPAQMEVPRPTLSHCDFGERKPGFGLRHCAYSTLRTHR